MPAQPSSDLPPPHDATPPRLASLPAAESLDRGRLALAGGVLAIVALGGGVLLAASRSALKGAAA